MSLLILLAAWLLWLGLVETVKQVSAEAKDRRDDRIMETYRHQEAARYHAQNLAEIARVRQATAEEMLWIATQADGEIIEGAATEIEPR